jgi:hypothetical protein
MFAAIRKLTVFKSHRRSSCNFIREIYRLPCGLFERFKALLLSAKSIHDLGKQFLLLVREVLNLAKQRILGNFDFLNHRGKLQFGSFNFLFRRVFSL